MTLAGGLSPRPALLLVAVACILSSASHLQAGEHDAPPVLVLRGDGLAAAMPTARNDVAALTTNVSRWLTAIGIASRVVSDRQVREDSLRSASLIILPYNQIDESLSISLSRAVQTGARIIACYTRAPASFYRLLGVEVGDIVPAADANQLRAIEFEREGAPVLGLPATMGQSSGRRQDLAARAGARVIGRWSGRGRLPAVTINPAGVYVGHVLRSTDPRAKQEFLAAVAVHLSPPLAEGMEARERRRCRAARDATLALWERNRPLIKPGRRRIVQVMLENHADATSKVQGDSTAERWQRWRRQRQRWEQLGYRCHPSPPHELRGVWIHTYSPTDWDAVMRRLAEANVNAAFVRVARGGNAIYRSRLLPRDAWAEKADVDELANAIEAAHRYGIQLHAWRVNFHLGSAPKDYVDKLRAEDRLVRDSHGKQALWANPGDARNLDLEVSAMLEMADNYPVDGIHFDYIRYPETPSYDFDYGPVSRREFERDSHLSVRRWPDDVLFGPLKLRYDDWQRSRINSVVRRVHEQMRQRHPDVLVSAAVWRKHRYYRGWIKQDWPLWLDQGWLDFVAPMDYTTDFADFETTVAAQAAVSSGRVPLVCGLGAWRFSSPTKLLDQIDALRARGARGFILFAWNDSLLAHLDALAMGATSSPAVPWSRVRDASVRVDGLHPGRDTPDIGGIDATYSYRVQAPAKQGVAWAWRLERPGGQILDDLGLSAPGESVQATGNLLLPAGVSRITVRATAAEGLAPVTESRLMEGVSGQQFESLVAESSPPVFTTAKTHVLVFDGGMSAEGQMTALKEADDLEPAFCHRFERSHYGQADVFLLSAVSDCARLTEHRWTEMRDWVRSGGRLLAMYQAVGYGVHPSPVWEIAHGTGRSRVQRLRFRVPLAQWKAGDQIDVRCPVLCPLEITGRAEVLAVTADESPRPVIAIADYGRGRVLFCGVLLGYRNEAEANERALIRALVGRLAGVDAPAVQGS